MFYWNTATLICLHVVCGYFYTMAELSCCNRDYRAYKAYNIYYLALYKGLLIPNI